MAAYLNVYTFDPVDFHRMLAGKIITRQGVLDLDILYNHAKDVVKHPSEITQYGLLSMGFDNDWLEDDEADIQELIDYWYLLSLMGVATSYKSYGGRRPKPGEGYGSVTYHVLPKHGWSEEDIQSLKYGDPMISLVQSSKIPQFVDIFQPALGGWLSVERAKRFLQSLRILENGIILHPTSSVYKSYRRLIGMLTMAIERQEALYMVFVY